jgi:hypothetical protein
MRVGIDLPRYLSHRRRDIVDADHRMAMAALHFIIDNGPTIARR